LCALRARRCRGGSRGAARLRARRRALPSLTSARWSRRTLR
jgi:hypothetical protein